MDESNVPDSGADVVEGFNTFGATVVDGDGLSSKVDELVGTAVASGVKGASLINGSPMMGYPFTSTKI